MRLDGVFTSRAGGPSGETFFTPPFRKLGEVVGKLETIKTKPPTLWHKIIYFVFGYSALLYGIYFLIAGIMYSSNMPLHSLGNNQKSLSFENFLTAR